MTTQATALKHIAELRPTEQWNPDPARILQSIPTLLNLAQGIAEMECRHCDAGVIRSVKSDRFYVGGREILAEDCHDCATLRALLDTFNAAMEAK